MVKLGLTGVYIIAEAVITSTHNLCFLSRNKKNIRIFIGSEYKDSLFYHFCVLFNVNVLTRAIDKKFLNQNC